MKLALTVYKDDMLTEVKRVAEADRLKIPYRVTTYIGQSLETLDIDNENELVNFVAQNLDKLDKVIKATFGVSELEMECIDAMELGAVAVEIYKWAIDKIKSLRGNNSKNVETTA